MSLERHIPLTINLDTLTLDESKFLTNLDFDTQFLDLNLSLEGLENYKLFLYFLIPDSKKTILVKEVNDLSAKTSVLIPKECLIYEGELNLEIAVSDKASGAFLTIPERISINVVKTLNSEKEAIVEKEFKNTIHSIFKELTNASNTSLEEFTTNINLIVEQNKTHLDEYKNTLSLELENSQNSFKESIFVELNALIEEHTNTINSLKDGILSEIISNKESALSSINEKIVDIKNNAQEQIRLSNIEMNKILDDLIKRIGKKDNDMYDQTTPSIRKELIDYLYSKKSDIVNIIKLDSITQLQNHIKTLQEQRFIAIKSVSSKIITLPATFVCNQMTKVFANGLMLTPGKDYTVSKGSIIFNKEFNEEQEIIVTETLAHNISTNMPNVSYDNISGTIVIRDNEGSFSANVKGNLEGNAFTASKLQNPILINGISFDGSEDINISVDQPELPIANVEEIASVFSEEVITIEKLINLVGLKEFHDQFKEFLLEQLKTKANSSHSHTLDNITETDTKKHFTVTEKNKLSSIAENANNYVHPEKHDASVITQNTNNRMVTDVQINTWTNDTYRKTEVYTKEEVEQKIQEAISSIQHQQ